MSMPTLEELYVIVVGSHGLSMATMWYEDWKYDNPQLEDHSFKAYLRSCLQGQLMPEQLAKVPYELLERVLTWGDDARQHMLVVPEGVKLPSMKNPYDRTHLMERTTRYVLEVDSFTVLDFGSFEFSADYYSDLVEEYFYFLARTLVQVEGAEVILAQFELSDLPRILGLPRKFNEFQALGYTEEQLIQMLWACDEVRPAFEEYGKNSIALRAIARLMLEHKVPF